MGSGLWPLGRDGIHRAGMAVARISLHSVLEKHCATSFSSIFWHFHSCPWFSNSCKWQKIIQETVPLSPKDVCHPSDQCVPRFPISFHRVFFLVGYSLLHLLFVTPTLSITFPQMNAKASLVFQLC